MADLRSALSELTWDEERLRVDFLKILDAIRAEFPRAPTHTLEGYLGTLLAEIRSLRAALAARDELLVKAGEHIATLLKWCPAQRGEWMDNDSFLRFKELRDEAVLFAAELKEKQP